jgi:hypothetical protein
MDEPEHVFRPGNMDVDTLSDTDLDAACCDLDEDYGHEPSSSESAFKIDSGGVSRAVHDYVRNAGCSWTRDPVRAEKVMHGLVTSEMYTLATCPVKDLQAARADALAHNLPLTEQMKVCATSRSLF